jgi:hypothetical protein
MNNWLKTLFLILFSSALVASETEARIKFYDLEGLVEHSDLIAQGSLIFDDCTERCIFQLLPARFFKWKEKDHNKIMICSFPLPNPKIDQWTDMKRFKQEIIIFTKKEGECYRPLGLQDAVIRTTAYYDGTIDTSRIRDEPRRQKLKDFQDKIEKEVRKNLADGAP